MPRCRLCAAARPPQAKGVDTIACISVNDAFVMDAWGKSVGAGDKVLMLADGNGQFAKALGVELDLNDKGLGVRSRRYALLADDQVCVQSIATAAPWCMAALLVWLPLQWRCSTRHSDRPLSCCRAVRCGVFVGRRWSRC